MWEVPGSHSKDKDCLYEVEVRGKPGKARSRQDDCAGLRRTKWYLAADSPWFSRSLSRRHHLAKLADALPRYRAACVYYPCVPRRR